MRRISWLLLVLTSCSAPGVEIRPVEGDFAFLEVKLKG